jgi:hypothetical protein
MGDTLTGGKRYYAGRVGVAYWVAQAMSDTQMGYIHDAVTALNTSISRT